MTSHFGFDLYLSDDQRGRASLDASVGHLYVLFGEVSIQVLCSSSHWIVWVSFIRKGTYTPVFLVALFTIAKMWKQPKCPSTDERDKDVVIYTVEYYSLFLTQRKTHTR